MCGRNNVCLSSEWLLIKTTIADCLKWNSCIKYMNTRKERRLSFVSEQKSDIWEQQANNFTELIMSVGEGVCILCVFCTNSKESHRHWWQWWWRCLTMTLRYMHNYIIITINVLIYCYDVVQIFLFDFESGNCNFATCHKVSVLYNLQVILHFCSWQDKRVQVKKGIIGTERSVTPGQLQICKCNVNYKTIKDGTFAFSDMREQTNIYSYMADYHFLIGDIVMLTALSLLLRAVVDSDGRADCPETAESPVRPPAPLVHMLGKTLKTNLLCVSLVNLCG